MATQIIKSGQTLSGIAKANNTTVSSIMKANPSITNANVIKAGANISIPSATPASGPVISDAVKSFNQQMVAGNANPVYNSSTNTYGGGTSSSIINNQSNIVTDTNTYNAKGITTGAKIDNAMNQATGVYGDGYGNTFNTQAEASESYNNKGIEKPKTETTVPEGNVQDKTGNSYFSSMPKDMTYELPSLPNTSKWVFDANGKPYEMDATGNVKNNVAGEQQYNTNLQYNKDIETKNTLLDSLKANVSMAHQAVIDSIKQKAQAQKTVMEDINKRYLGAKTVAGFRTGGTEYTPEIAMGILKNEEEEGIRRIQEIDDNMTLALAEAVSAKNRDELDVAQQKFDTYTKLQSAKEDSITNQLKMYIDNQKYLSDLTKGLETETRAKQDQALQLLKTNARGYVDGYNSSKDKNAYVESIATELGLSPESVLSQIKVATPKPITPKATTVKKQTATEIKADAIGIMSTLLESGAGPDDFVDPEDWKAARVRWGNEGLNDADFLKNFKRFLNPESYKLIPEFAPKKTTGSGRNITDN